MRQTLIQESDSESSDRLLPPEVERISIAQELFDRFREASAWEALLRTYLASGNLQGAFQLYERMYQDLGLQPKKHVLVSLAKLCASNSDLDKGRRIHHGLVVCESDSGVDSSIGKDPYLANAIVDMYAKCGSLCDAREVFGNILVKGVILWTTLISAYAKHDGCNGLICYEEMRLEGFFPDIVTLTCVLKACAKMGFDEKGKEIHALVLILGFERDGVVGSSLVDMYCDCGLLEEAQQVFDRVQAKDVVIWTSLISGYTEHGDGERALVCFELMQLEGHKPNRVTFICCLKACGSIGAIERGMGLHAEIARKGLLEPTDHEEVYHRRRNFLGNADSSNKKRSVDLVHNAEIEPRNGLTEQVLHAGIEHRDASLERARLNVGNALVDLYVKCGWIAKAREVFKSLSVRDVVSWNVLISGYESHGKAKEAMICYAEMQKDRVLPDETTFVYLLKACGHICDAKKGQELHHEVVRRGLMRIDIDGRGRATYEKEKAVKRGILSAHHVGNALVGMYAKCGFLARAVEIFEKLQYRDAVSYNALLLGYISCGRNDRVLECFEQMQCDGIPPDSITFLCMLRACGSIGAIETGKHLHMEIVEEGLSSSSSSSSSEADLDMGNALVAMYARCGLLDEAHRLFDELPSHDVVTWTALIAGYAQLGEAEKAISAFNRLKEESPVEEPCPIAFVNVLNVCNHGGWVEIGELCFREMVMEHRINPALEHYTCLIDLFCRAGQMSKAVALIDAVPAHPDLVMWHTLLGACLRQGHGELGKAAFEHAVCLNDMSPSSYVFLSNIVCVAGSSIDR
jgi:pentatricopeptide repeat protein